MLFRSLLHAPAQTRPLRRLVVSTPFEPVRVVFLLLRRELSLPTRCGGSPDHCVRPKPVNGAPVTALNCLVEPNRNRLFQRGATSDRGGHDSSRAPADAVLLQENVHFKTILSFQSLKPSVNEEYRARKPVKYEPDTSHLHHHSLTARY